ncbi:MAG TPA: fibronectin type III domain-containing protein [Steroidobacteraceae bacterium]|jgi:hypothetical protein
MALSASAAPPTTVEYTYDDAGRLKTAVAPEMDAAYTLDAAGNRTLVKSTTGHGWPSSISVPTSNYTQTYSVTWGDSTGTGNSYELYEATNPNFYNQTSVYTGTGTQRSVTLNSKPYGTYYYRIRVCEASGCGPHRVADNPIVVAPPPPPGVPASITIPATDIDGVYTISWGTSSGALAEIPLMYQVYEATASNFSNQVQIFNGTGTSVDLNGRATGTYYYRVRGCNGPSCSAYRTGGNSMVVTLTPNTPGSVINPAFINVGNYTVTWTAPGGIVPVTRYELFERVGLGSDTLIYSGLNLSFPVSGKPDGTYSYKVRACNAGCSADSAPAGSTMVDTVAPTPPASLSRTQQTFLNWSGGSTDSGGGGSGSLVDRWRVYRNGSLIATVLYPTQAYNDTAAPSNQTHTWTVRSVDRAGNESVNSPPLTVYVDTIPPGAPTIISAVGLTTQSIQITWNAAVDPNGGTVSGYFVYRNGVNQQLASGTSLVDVGLIPSTTYTYTVAAFDSGGNVGPQSAPMNGTTLTDIPTVPNIPSSINVSPSGRWGSPSYTVFWGGSGPPTSYYVLEEQGIPTNVTGGFTSKSYSGKPPGFYNYRVKACSPTNICSAYTDYVSYEVCGSGGCQ